MNRIAKVATGAAAAALATVATAAPASAQYYGRSYGYDHRYRDRGIDAGDIIAGVAIIGGIAAITSALSRDQGYGYGYRYRGGYQAAVRACGYEAERTGRGRVRITDVDRAGNDRFRVRGVVENAYGGGYDRYDRYDRYGRDYGYGSSYYGSSYGESFTCTARGNGRITGFRLNDRHYGYRY
jgi:hypothetical protein